MPRETGNIRGAERKYSRVLLTLLLLAVDRKFNGIHVCTVSDSAALLCSTERKLDCTCASGPDDGPGAPAGSGDAAASRHPQRTRRRRRAGTVGTGRFAP